MIDIEKVNRRFRSHYYSSGKLEQWPDKPEYLLAGGSYPTKIRPQDLPPWYIPITHWTTRYVDTSRVTNLIYTPCPLHPHNHLFKDDYLYLHYDGVKPVYNHDGPGAFLVSEHEVLWGNELVDGLFSAKEYSGIDITQQLEQLRTKILRYNDEYMEPWPDPFIPYDPDKLFADAKRRVQERKEAYEALHQGTHRH